VVLAAPGPFPFILASHCHSSTRLSDASTAIRLATPASHRAAVTTSDRPTGPFTYLDPATGRSIAASYATAFFRATLNGDEGATAYLAEGFPDDVVGAEHHE